jgi:thiamine-phosphate pyrophosphorylase
MRGYYFITDSNCSRQGNEKDVIQALTAGVEIVQLRDKSATSGELYREAKTLRKLCAGTKSRLIINDRVDIALAVNADGVHLGQEDLPCEVARRLLGEKKIIGVTVHNLREALTAEKASADYLGVSPIFATSTKSDAGTPCGLETLREIRAHCKIPIVAIGGINLQNARDVIEAGADMICAISATLTKENVAEEIGEFQRRFER